MYRLCKEVALADVRFCCHQDKISFNNVNLTNVAKVVVYYRTMTTQSVDQQPSWTTAKLFSSLGGFMGMYVGFSFLSLVEVFEIFMRRLGFWIWAPKTHFWTLAKVIGRTAGRLKINQDKQSKGRKWGICGS